MLKQIRENSRIFLYLLIIAFVAWLGFDAITTTQRNPSAGKIFGKKVNANDFQGALLAARTQAVLRYGDKLREVENDLKLSDDAWDRLILLHEARKERIKVSDKEVVNLIKNSGLFSDKNGGFSKRAYEEGLRYGLGLTPAEFEQQERDNLAIQKLIEKQNEKVTLTDDDALKAYKLMNEKVKASYIPFRASDYLAQVTAGEDEVRSFFEKNKAAFTIPEQANVEYFGKTLSAAAGEDEKSKTRKEMKDVFYELAGGKDLQGVAKKYSLPVKETGFFSRESQISDIGWDLKFADTALSTNTGDIAGPVETKTGIYLLKVKEKKPAHPAEFTQAKEEAGKALKMKKSDALAKEKAGQALTELKAEMDKKEKFEAFAKNLSLTVKETDAFTRDSYIEGLAVSPEFAQAAFSLKEGEVYKDPVKIHDGYAIVKQNSLVPIDEKKYQEEKDKFKEQLLAQKRYFNFIKWFMELKKSANLQSNTDKMHLRNP